VTCQIDIDACDAGEYRPAVFVATDRKARKIHRCHECYRDILPGETYREERGLWDGEWSTWKTCADCLSVRDVMFSQYQYGELWEDVAAYVDDVRGNVPEDCLAALTPAARQKVCALIEDAWGRVIERYGRNGGADA
jgi:hypothetical protein